MTTIHPCKLKAVKVVPAVEGDVLAKTDAMTVEALTGDEGRCSIGLDKPTEIAIVDLSAMGEEGKTWAATFREEMADATSTGADHLHCHQCVAVHRHYRVGRHLGRVRYPNATTALSLLALSTRILFKSRAPEKCVFVAQQDLMAFRDVTPRCFMRLIHV